MMQRSIPVPAQPCPDLPVASLPDLRFRHLLGRGAWDGLPDRVRQRFGKRLGPGQSASYAGQVLDCRISRAGWVLAQACRLIGAPLPLDRGGDMAAVVSVTEDAVTGGQVWSRLYARRNGFPQVIHSAKRFAGPTGLEEYLGLGFGIALSVAVCGAGIRFTSAHYFLRLGRWRWRLPRLLAPGHLTIEHRDKGAGAFSFTLTLRHRLLGEMLHQTSLFHDQIPQEHCHD